MRRNPNYIKAEARGMASDMNQLETGILATSYPMNWEACLSDELLLSSDFLNTEAAKKSLDATTSSAVAETERSSGNESDHDDDIHLNVDSLEKRMYRLLVSNNLETVFPNTVIVIRIYLNLMISNCSGERSFTNWNYIRACMKQERARATK